MAEAAKDKTAAAEPDATDESQDGAEGAMESTEHVPVTSDTKSAFQAALERKK